MAYPARGREPLLDSETAAAVERRSKELIGIGLLVLAFLATLMVWSYSPNDPNWMVSTDAPVQNWLGRTGASLAGMLFTIVGWGTASLVLILAAWGVRFALHQGSDRALGRLIFAPIWVAAFAIYAATLQPETGWVKTHSFGLGGLFGDMVMGFILTVLPLGSAFSVKMMSLLMAVAIVGFGAFILGFTRPEVNRLVRWFLLGLVITYAGFMTLLGRGARAGVMAAQSAKARRAERKESARVAAEEQAAWEASQPIYDCLLYTSPSPRDLSTSRMPSSA